MQEEPIKGILVKMDEKMRLRIPLKLLEKKNFEDKDLVMVATINHARIYVKSVLSRIAESMPIDAQRIFLRQCYELHPDKVGRVLIPHDYCVHLEIEKGEAYFVEAVDHIKMCASHKAGKLAYDDEMLGF